MSADAADVPAARPVDEEVAAVLRQVFEDNELEWEQTGSSFNVVMQGERKLQTPCRLDIGEHSVQVHAFVCRRPDENAEGVYRWLLQRNMKTYAVAFAIDAAGDIYLDARLPLAVITAEEVDRLLGAVLEHADGSFNTILELGFASSIRQEWDWRTSRGESTRNLEAFVGPLGLDRRATATPTSASTPPT